MRLVSPARLDPDATQEQIARALEGNEPLDPRQSYADQLHALLRRTIVRGRLLPGAALSEAAIASAVGVSRTPVREAFRLLAQEHLVEVFPQAGTVVAPIRLDLIHEGRFVRRSLESANLADLVRTVGDGQLEGIRSLVAAQRGALGEGKVDEFFALDESMHRRFFELTGRARVWTLIEGAKVHLDRLRWLMLDRLAGDAQRAYDEHTKIVACLAKRDARALNAAINDHIDFVTQHLLRLREVAPQSYFVDRDRRPASRA
jgi:DNA-binding GntR family transcriptional regulator